MKKAMERLILRIEQNKMKLDLVSGQEVLDSAEWREKDDLSRKLLAKIDAILRKNKIGLDKISGYKIISQVPRKWTTCRIAEITFQTLDLPEKSTCDTIPNTSIS